MTAPPRFALDEAARAVIHEMALRDMPPLEAVAVLAGCMAALIGAAVPAECRPAVARVAGRSIETLVEAQR